MKKPNDKSKIINLFLMVLFLQIVMIIGCNSDDDSGYIPSAPSYKPYDYTLETNYEKGDITDYSYYEYVNGFKSKVISYDNDGQLLLYGKYTVSDNKYETCEYYNSNDQKFGYKKFIYSDDKISEIRLFDNTDQLISKQIIVYNGEYYDTATIYDNNDNITGRIDYAWNNNLLYQADYYDALDNLESSIQYNYGLVNSEKGVYIGNYSGNYDGDDAGTWTLKIDANGIASGNAFSHYYEETYPLSGNVSVEGLLEVSGRASTWVGDAFFSGIIVHNNVSGDWIQHTYNQTGTFTGSKNIGI